MGGCAINRPYNIDAVYTYPCALLACLRDEMVLLAREYVHDDRSGAEDRSGRKVSIAVAKRLHGVHCGLRGSVGDLEGR